MLIRLSRGPLTSWLFVLVSSLVAIAPIVAPVLAAPPASPPVTTARAMRLQAQGDRLTVNGRTYPIPWAQWVAPDNTPHIGLSDVGLQRLGLELLDTNTPQQQPVQWFSLPTQTPLVLPARQVNGYRLLDVTPLLTTGNWTLQAKGATLELVTPLTTIAAVRYGRQSWGDRLVLDLDQPTLWTVDERGREITITVDAQLAPDVLANFKPTLQGLVRTATLSTAQGKTQLKLALAGSARIRTWSLPNQPRLIVDVRPDALTERNLAWANGLRWRQSWLTLGSDRFPVTWLEIAPGTLQLQLQPIVPNPQTMTGIAPLVQTARQSGVAAAINGGFFNRNNQLPLGAVRQAGQWFSGPILNRGAIGWNNQGQIVMGRLSLQETVQLPDGATRPLTHLNSGYVQAGIARYTPTWGPTYTPLTDAEIAVIVRRDRVVSQQALPKAGQTPVAIPPDGYLLILRAIASAAPQFAPGTPLRLTQQITPSAMANLPNIVAAGPLLISNRQSVLNAGAEGFSRAFANQKASRSAIARRADGTLLLVTVHERLNGRGPSLTELVRLLQQMDVTDALNLDGGSSTTLYLGGQIIDRPPATAARVHNGLGILLAPARE